MSSAHVQAIKSKMGDEGGGGGKVNKTNKSMSGKHKKFNPDTNGRNLALKVI